MPSSPTNHRSNDRLFRCDLHLDGEPRHCSAPAAIMDRDGLTFIVRHHGERHRVRIPLAELQLEMQKMLTKFNEVVDTVPRMAITPP